MTSNVLTNLSIILITGATDGIGLALARYYHEKGARLVLIGRRPLAELDQQFFTRQNYCQADLAQPTCAAQILSWLHENSVERLDLLIQNAAQGYVGSLADQSETNIRQLIGVNLMAPILLTHALLPLLTTVGGKLVFISSVASALPGPNYAVYTASKTALDGFVRNLQIELKAMRSPVQTQIIHPGATRTGMHAKSGANLAQLNWEKFPDAESVATRISQAITSNRPTVTIGMMNQLAQFAGRHMMSLVDTSLIFSTRKTNAKMLNQPNSTHLRRHCVITGAADGIGKALAEAFAAADYTITGIDLDAERAKQVETALQQSDPTSRILLADLSKADDLQRLQQQLAERAPIDVLIHNAGISAVGPFATTSIERQISVIQVNLLAPLLLTAALLQQKRLAPRSSLAFISSLSHFVGYPGAVVYAASKDGIASFARSLRVALASAGHHVLTIFPGPTRTAHARRYSPDNRNEQRRMAPEQLAQQILQAVERRQATLIPGLGNQLFALVGQWLPGVTAQLMRRTIFDKLYKP